MAKYAIEDSTLSGIADAIRSKTGGTGQILTEEMAAEIRGITGGEGGEVWIWTKYSVAQAERYEENRAHDAPLSMPEDAIDEHYDSYSFDRQTGVFTLFNSGEGSTCYMPTTSEQKIYNHISKPNQFIPGRTEHTYWAIEALLAVGAVKGDTCYGVVSSEDRAAYPEDGEQDGFWYVLVGDSAGGAPGGIDTSDATATPNDLAEDSTAYVNGEKITGTLKVYAENKGTQTLGLPPAFSSGIISFRYIIPSDRIMRTDSYLTAGANASAFGDATAADVASGKTFTSAAGLKVVGTKVDGGGTAPVLQEKTVTPSTSQQEVTPDATYDGLSKVTVNAMPSAILETPTITVDSAGKITAQVQQTAAAYVLAGTKSATKQLTTKGAATITPGTANQTIASGTYLTGTQTIKGDANLKAANIKQGVSIFGIAGSFAGSGGSSGGGGIPGTITAGDTPVLASFVGKNNSTKNTPSDTGASVTIQHAGTYRFKIPSTIGGSALTGGSATVYLYKNGVQAASHSVSSSVTAMQSDDITCEAGDVISVWSMAGGTTYSTYNAITMGLIACIDWDNGF